MQFTMAVRCENCEGKGTTESTVYAQEIMLIILHNIVDNEIQKIPAIKEVRNQYGIGLKAAKELVEGAMDFFYAIKKNASQIPNPESTQDEDERWYETEYKPDDARVRGEHNDG